MLKAYVSTFNYCKTVQLCLLLPLQIGQWPFTATSVSTHCLQIVVPHGTKTMCSHAATRQTSHVVGTEAAAGVTVAAAVTVTSLLLCPLPSSSVRSYSSVLLPLSSWVKTFVTDFRAMTNRRQKLYSRVTAL